jgi:hypothetical protein
LRNIHILKFCPPATCPNKMKRATLDPPSSSDKQTNPDPSIQSLDKYISSEPPSPSSRLCLDDVVTKRPSWRQSHHDVRTLPASWRLCRHDIRASLGSSSQSLDDVVALQPSSDTIIGDEVKDWLLKSFGCDRSRCISESEDRFLYILLNRSKLAGYVEDNLSILNEKLILHCSSGECHTVYFSEVGNGDRCTSCSGEYCGECYMKTGFEEDETRAWFCNQCKDAYDDLSKEISILKDNGEWHFHNS